MKEVLNINFLKGYKISELKRIQKESQDPEVQKQLAGIKQYDKKILRTFLLILITFVFFLLLIGFLEYVKG